MNAPREDTLTTMIVDLEKDESLLAVADEALGHALAHYRVSAARYMAVRDAIAEYLGHSPYSQKTRHLWPMQDRDWSEHHGRYRFLGKDPGAAIDEILRDADEPLLVTDILGKLKEGGLKEINGKSIDGRTVHAALLSNKEAKKDEEGRYYYEELLLF